MNSNSYYLFRINLGSCSLQKHSMESKNCCQVKGKVFKIEKYWIINVNNRTEEDSNLPPSKHRKPLDMKKCFVCHDLSSGKKVNVYILSIFKGTGKKLLGVTVISEINFALFFSYIDTYTSNISIFLPNFPYINIFIAYKLYIFDRFAIRIIVL